MDTTKDLMRRALTSLLGLEKAAATGNIDAQLFDLDAMSVEEIRQLGSMTRMVRLVDADLQQIIADHTIGVTNVASADKMVDICTESYLLDRPLSFQGISLLAEAVCARVEKFGVSPSPSLLNARNGNFDYRAEVDPDE